MTLSLTLLLTLALTLLLNPSPNPDLEALLEAAPQRHEVGRPIVEQALLAERGDQQGEGSAQVAPHLVRGSGD